MENQKQIISPSLTLLLSHSLSNSISSSHHCYPSSFYNPNINFIALVLFFYLIIIIPIISNTVTKRPQQFSLPQLFFSSPIFSFFLFLFAFAFASGRRVFLNPLRALSKIFGAYDGFTSSIYLMIRVKATEQLS